MKKLVIILFFAPLISCSVEADTYFDTDVTGKWILVQTWGQYAGSEQTGEEMPFQETFYLKGDGSFQKVRVRDGEELEVTGTYELSETETRLFIVLQHESENPLIANCTLTLTEHLFFTTDGKLRGTHDACDGLGVLYEKIK